MHAYTLPNIILALLLALSSFLESPNSISVEARKLATSNGVFKVDLIHRDSPLSPYYNSSMTPKERAKRAPLGYISHGHNIHLHNKIDANSYALKANNGGEYLMKITLGTPKVDFLVLADTGSDLIWVQCQPCNTTNTCFPQQSPLFDPTKSSTYHPIPCTSPDCTHPDLNTSCASYNTKSSSSCTYQNGYGDSDNITQIAKGILATESISLPSSNNSTSITLPSSIFGCGMDQPHFQLGSEVEGIVGLGAGPSSLVSQLGPKINYKFSYCLAPLTSGVSSKLTFGADITGPNVVSTPFQVGFTGIETTYYNLTLNGISVGDKNNPVQLNSGLGIVIDSGTTLTMLPTNTYYSLSVYLENAIGLKTVPSPTDDSDDLCYSTKSLGQISIPDVVFQFQGADVVLKASNTFWEIEDGVSCLAMLPTDYIPIFGNIAQTNFEVGYDLKAKQVSFAPADCTKY